MVANAKSPAFGQRLKHFRNSRGMTQDQLARKADIPYTTLTKIETGVIKNPSIQTVLKLAKGLNCSLDQLVTQKGGML
jgi:transcriptional regulator with XRE-family HTH domain